VKILADSPRDVPFALIYLAGADGSAHLAAATGLPAGDPALGSADNHPDGTLSVAIACHPGSR
jgi:hypothetical protein